MFVYVRDGLTIFMMCLLCSRCLDYVMMRFLYHIYALSAMLFLCSFGLLCGLCLLAHTESKMCCILLYREMDRVCGCVGVWV